MSKLIRESNIPKDNLIIKERLNGGPTGTHIIMKDHDTGEILQEGHNKILVPGSQVSACNQFGLSQVVEFPTYNTLLGLDHSKTAWSTPSNVPITCLWGVGRDGYATSANEILVVSNTDRIEPPTTSGSTTTYDLIPFRYQAEDNDLSEDLRTDTYFGRVDNTTTGYISYYFKAFDTTPQLHVRYLDGTEVTSNMYTMDSSQSVEVYVEMRLSITRLDFRDFFNKVLGWDNATISTLSLFTAWYDNTICENPTAETADQIYYKWYQDIIPFSKWNFSEEKLVDLTRAIDFIYQVYY